MKGFTQRKNHLPAKCVELDFQALQDWKFMSQFIQGRKSINVDFVRNIFDNVLTEPFMSELCTKLCNTLALMGAVKLSFFHHSWKNISNRQDVISTMQSGIRIRFGRALVTNSGKEAIPKRECRCKIWHLPSLQWRIPGPQTAHADSSWCSFWWCWKKAGNNRISLPILDWATNDRANRTYTPSKSIGADFPSESKMQVHSGKKNIKVDF